MKESIVESINTGDWFVLEPYVMFFSNCKHQLFYNTLNGDYLEVLDCKSIKNITDRLDNEKIYTVEISKEDNSDPELMKFIFKMKQKFMGEVFSKKDFRDKPFQFSPVLNFQKDSERFKEGLFSSEGENTLLNLLELNLYLNSHPFSADKQVYNFAYKQFLSPFFNSDKNELSVEMLQLVFFQLAHSNLSNINILGGNIFQHSEFNKVIKTLSDCSFKKTFHIHSSQIEEIQKLQFCENYSIVVYFEYPYPENLFATDFGSQTDLHISFSFIVQNIQEFKSAESMIEKYNLSNYMFQPFFNESNFDFFKENIFLSEDDLFETRVSQQELFARMKINKNHFGKLNILPNGDVYSNLNLNRLGNIKKQSCKYLIYREIKEGSSWRNTRNKAMPCKDCVYNLLCPPLSNYEYVLKRNNLCLLVTD